MVEMGGLISTIIESIVQDKKKSLLKRPWHFHDKVYGENVSIYFCLTSDRFSVFHGYRLTRLGPPLSVGLEVGIHHDSFEHHIEA